MHRIQEVRRAQKASRHAPIKRTLKGKMTEPESLRDALTDIRRKLNAGAYQNEEHVRLSLVARVVQALGWVI